jgi:1-acyl-sn-glycerol-3-phosphate acyltransferase
LRSSTNLSRLEKERFNVTLSQRIVVGSLKGITSLICRIDDAELGGVPKQGPLIIYCNHVNILEIPIVYTHLQPRIVHGMMLAERWKIPILRWMLDVTDTIPIHRGEADLLAIRQGLKALKKGEMIVILPEGTRSRDGKLQPAHPGVVLLALHSHAPLIPVAYYGAECYKENLRRLKRTDFHLRVGKAFHLDPHGATVTRPVREKMMDELMFQLAAVLPPEYRGHYADQAAATTQYIDFG